MEAKVVPIPSEVARIRSALLNAADTQPVLEMRHLVKGWLSESGLSVLYGPSNSGKTFVALSIAAHVASGRPWCGCKTRASSVLYIALEGGLGFRNRIAAVRRQIPELKASRRLHYIATSLDLYEADGLQDLCDALPDEEWSLIVIDTLARAMAGADENAARDMGKFVGNLDWLRETTGAHVMVVHHSGKDITAGARGSSALRAAVDTELSLSDTGELKATKQRDMAAASPLYFDLQSVSFGINADGEEVTSAIALATDAPKAKSKPLTGQAEVAMQALSEAIRTHGEKRHGEHYPTNRKCVRVDDWRDICERMGLTDCSKGAQQKAFLRARDKLLAGNHIRIWDDHVWRVLEDE